MTTDYVVTNRDDNDYCKEWCKYLLYKHFDYLYQEYAILNNKLNTIRTVYYNDRIITDNSILKTLTTLITRYNINRYDWFNKPLIGRYNLAYYYKGWSKKHYIIDKVPTIKQIYNGTFFTKEAQQYIVQRSFWTWYCKGKDISFKDVQTNWNKVGLSEDIIKDYHLVENTTWRNYIKCRANRLDEIDANLERFNLKQSNDNRQRALDALLKGKSAIDVWRNTDNYMYLTVTYNKWCRKARNSPYKHWKECKENLYVGNLLDNIQFRFYENDNTIVTSKHIRVSLTDAITVWNIFCKYRDLYISKYGEVNKDNLAVINLSGYDYKVLGYTIKRIYYKEKYTNAGNPLGYYEWCIVIGCHHIWIDDFIEFVNYYKLNDVFKEL